MTKPTGEEKRNALEDLLFGTDEQKASVEQASPSVQPPPQPSSTAQTPKPAPTSSSSQPASTPVALQEDLRHLTEEKAALQEELRRVREAQAARAKEQEAEKARQEQRRKAEAEILELKREIEKARAALASPDMVPIAGGTFLMGSPVDDRKRRDNEVQHRVMVSGFYIGTYPVTQKDYQALMGTNPSRFKGDNLPVERVSWYDAVAYCNARSRKEGLTPAYTISGTNVSWNRSANGYRLPTEAEWEYACRAGTTTPFSTGNTITTSQANYDGEKTTPVGSFTANACRASVLSCSGIRAEI